MTKGKREKEERNMGEGARRRKVKRGGRRADDDCNAVAIDNAPPPTALHPRGGITAIYRRIRYLLCTENSRVPYKMISSSLLSFSRGDTNDDVPRRITLYLGVGPSCSRSIVSSRSISYCYRFVTRFVIFIRYFSAVPLTIFNRRDRFRSTRRSYFSVFVNSYERL